MLGLVKRPTTNLVYLLPYPNPREKREEIGVTTLTLTKTRSNRKGNSSRGYEPLLSTIGLV